MTQATRSDVFSALAKKAGFTVLEEKETEKQLRIIGRCLPDRWPFFAPVVSTILDFSEREDIPWTCDPSKLYMKKASKLVYGWRLIFQVSAAATSHNMGLVYGSICSAILSAPLPARVEVDTVLLPGHRPGQVRGGVNAKGKGSSSAGAMPMILNRTR